MLPVFRKLVALIYERKVPVTSMISDDRESGIVKTGKLLEKTVIDHQC